MEKEIVWVEEKIFYTWTWTISDTRKFVIEKYGGSYRLLRYGFGSDGLLGVPHYTLDKAKDEAVWHYLRAYPDMTMSEDGARLVPRIKDEQSIRPKKIQTESRNPQQENPVGPKQIIQYVDRSKTQPVASAGLPHNVPANLRNHRQMTESASPSTSLHEGNTSFIPNSESGLDSGKTTAIGKPMITHETPIAEVLHILGAHGCENITDQLDTSSFSKYPISSGGYGDIYRGALRNGTAIAVKCLRLHPDLNETTNKQLKRAARELYVWSKCGHPNVLGLIGVAQYREQIAMVSPWMERGSLRLLLFRQEEFDRYAMCVQITDGVAYMHRENMVHGDLKCDNVLISSDFIPKITDFGNASLKEYTLQFTNTTSSAGISLNWVAPEMLTGQSQATMGSDVYSLGMTLLEAITGEVPYNGMSHHMIMFAKVMTRALPVRPEAHIPSHIQHANLLWSLFESCWAFNPEDRPSAHKVKEMMEQVMMTRGSGNPSE